MNDLMQIARTFRTFRADRRGVALLEYGLLAALIAVVCIGVLSTLGTDLSSVFSGLGTSISAATTAAGAAA